jgi:hypothetical protein
MVGRRQRELLIGRTSPCYCLGGMHRHRWGTSHSPARDKKKGRRKEENLGRELETDNYYSYREMQRILRLQADWQQQEGPI